jgi:hypothetical protein
MAYEATTPASARKRETAGSNLLWFVPLCLIVVAVIIIPVGLLAFENCRSLWRHFTWGLLVSPSFYMFVALTLTSPVLPIAFLTAIPETFTASPSQRFIRSLTILLSIVCVSVVIQIFLWGSYPLGWDSDGTEHLRLIPFFPWPRIPFLRWIWGN